MPTRRLAACAAAFTLAFAAALLSADLDAGERRRPNVILIFIDDLGYGDVGAFGCTDIPTPHIDSLAATGVKCTWSYITNPPCCPSRCSLLTGMYAQRFGKAGMSRGLPIPEDHPTFPETMRDAGYVTGHIGKWDLGRNQGPLSQGFRESPLNAPLAGKPGRGAQYSRVRADGSPVHLVDLEGEYLLDFVERHRADPFFLYWSPVTVHIPLKAVPQSYLDRAGKKVPAKRRHLAASVIQLDDKVGALLAKLDEHGLREDTLIIFSSDNGADPKAGASSAPYRGGKGKGTQQEGWVHVPTIFSWPGTLPAGTTYEGMMCSLDFYPTAAAVAGAAAPEACDGVDLRPWLAGEKQGDAHAELFWYNADPEDAKHRHLQAMREKRWRLVLDQKAKAWRLFDLHADPEERRDLAAAHPDVVARMKARHAGWVATMPPITSLKTVRDYQGPGGNPGKGWGWATAEGWPELPKQAAPAQPPDA